MGSLTSDDGTHLILVIKSPARAFWFIWKTALDDKLNGSNGFALT